MSPKPPAGDGLMIAATHPRSVAPALVAILALVLATLAAVPPGVEAAGPDPVRFATFNASLNRNFEGQLRTDLSTPDNAQAATVAEIIQRVDPDVLLINEFDFDAGGGAALFHDELSRRCRTTARAAVEYPYLFIAPSNTGIPSGLRSEQQRRDRRPGRRVRLRVLPRPVRHGACSRSTRSTPTRSAPSRPSCGRTCPARFCPTIRAPPRRPTGTRPTSSTVFRLSSKIALGRPDR